MQNFLEQVLYQLHHSSYTLEKLTFVVPSKRAVTFLKKHLSSNIEAPIFSPTMYSIEDFVMEIANLNYATTTELLFELYVSYNTTTSGQKDDFHSFLKWGQTLLQDFNEINRHLADEQDLFSYLSSIQKLKHWGIADKKTELISNYIAFWNNLPAIYNEFNKRLLNRQTGYQGLVYRQAYKCIDSYININKENTFIFIGFNALNKAESQIIQKFLSNGNADIYFDIDNYFLEENIHAAGYFIRNYKKNWTYLKNTALKGVSENYKQEKSIQIIGVPKSVSQAKYTGALLKKLYAKNNLSNTALVLADENLLNPILNVIPKEISSANITMGLTFTKSPLASFFENIFELHSNKSENGFFYKDVLRLLSNPYASILFSDNLIDYSKKLKNKIHKNNWIFLKLERIFLAIQNENPLYSKFFADSIDTSSLLKLLQDIIEQLKQKINKEKSSYDLEELYHYYKICNQISKYLSIHSFILNNKSLKALFFELLNQEKLDFEGDPVQGLQIMGMLETRVLDFETVIITSVNEGILPSGKSNNSFIPYDVKVEFGLPTYKDKDAIFTYHFYRLIQRAKNIYLLYNTEPDVLEGGEKSRFITQLLTDENINQFVSHIIASPTVKSNSKKDNSVQKTSSLIYELKLLAAKGFSPTSLTNYIKNPLHFYKRNILKIDAVKEVEESIALNTFGTIIHDSLEDFYRPLINKQLSSAMLLRLKEEIPVVIKQNYLKSHVGADLTKGKNLIIYNVIKKYIENFIKTEEEQLKNHQIKIIAIEQNLEIELDFPELDFPILLKGKIDRVDEIDGQLRIIDYKTGNVTSNEVEIIDWDSIIKEEKYNKAFQLLCYALMYSNNTIKPSFEAGIIPIKKLSAGILRFAIKQSARGQKNHQINSKVLSDFELQLKHLILEIFNPKIPFMEKEM